MGRKKKTHEEFVDEVYNLVGNEYEVIGTYTSSLNKIEMFHVKCGRSFHVISANFLFGHRCSKCGDRRKKTHENFLKEVESKFGNDYKILGTYIRGSDKILVKHNSCDYEWNVTPNNLLQGKSKCPNCSKKVQFTTESFRKIISDITNGEYLVIGNYINTNTKITMKHLVCGHEWEVVPCQFKDDGSRCPKCNVMSKGEKKIYEYFTNNNIKFKNEYTFETCKNIYSLPFDFALLDQDKKVLALIEFDGIQHYESIEWFGGENILKYTQFNDSIKNNFCHENNIRLLRIPYWELNNVEIILDDLLNTISMEIN